MKKGEKAKGVSKEGVADPKKKHNFSAKGKQRGGGGSKLIKEKKKRSEK